MYKQDSAFYAIVNFVFANDGGRLVVADVAVKSFDFRVVTVYTPNIAAERVFFFQRLALFLDDPKRIVLVGDWNTILDPKVDRVGWGARRSGRCESSLIDLVYYDLVDWEVDVDVARKFALCAKPIWTVLVRRALTDFTVPRSSR